MRTFNIIFVVSAGDITSHKNIKEKPNNNDVISIDKARRFNKDDFFPCLFSQNTWILQYLQSHWKWMLHIVKDHLFLRVSTSRLLGNIINSYLSSLKILWHFLNEWVVHPGPPSRFQFQQPSCMRKSCKWRCDSSTDKFNLPKLVTTVMKMQV